MNTGRPSRFLAIALAGEGLLAVAGWLWARAAGYPLETGPVAASLTIGIVTAAGLAAVQWWLLRLAPDRGPVRALRALYREWLRPLFGRARLRDILLVSAMAGVGEELLFRGAMQPAWGWLAASLIFGACHAGGRGTWPLALWAAVTGGLLGWLAIVTNGLLAPIVAHAVYDALALGYIRWGPPLPAEATANGGS
ncbi:MAG TPA: CPBP family intramembrane glutamic endopeptidase [Vicinamibacterales bacterium]